MACSLVCRVVGYTLALSLQSADSTFRSWLHLPAVLDAGAILPIPKKPMSAKEYDAEKARFGEGASEEDIQAAMMKHEAGDAEKRWREEKAWLKGRWWRYLNRVMSVIGVLVVGAVVSIPQM